MKLTLFNKPTYKRFSIPPRYYDEEKSDFQRRMRKWEREKQEEKSGFNKEDFREEMRRNWSHSRESNNKFNQRYTNGRRMLVLLIIMGIIIWTIYFLGKKYLV